MVVTAPLRGARIGGLLETAAATPRPPVRRSTRVEAALRVELVVLARQLADVGLVALVRRIAIEHDVAVANRAAKVKEMQTVMRTAFPQRRTPLPIFVRVRLGDAKGSHAQQPQRIRGLDGMLRRERQERSPRWGGRLGSRTPCSPRASRRVAWDASRAMRRRTAFEPASIAALPRARVVSLEVFVRLMQSYSHDDTFA